uniref:Pentapeptide repeat-containing protein n=1 Tax=Rhodococcus hoagii TaxID=43767 RepID=A0A0F7ICJ6_RHOHA|nr:hypothetical protein pVAPN_1480 [Prescottella equi]
MEQQVCVNVLCSYLRANARLAPESRPLDGNQHADSGFDENERAVRASILEVIRGRSRQWCEHSNLVFDLRNARLRGADLTGAHLTNAILIGANLSGVKLDNAVLRGAQLQDSNLSGACLNGADLTGANLEMAQINEKTQHMGAITTEATLPEHWLTAR